MLVTRYDRIVSNCSAEKSETQHGQQPPRAHQNYQTVCSSMDLEPANAGILIEACYTEPIMTRFVKKYWTVLRVGLVVSWIRFSLRRKSLPLVLDRLSPRSMTGRPDEAVMGDLVYYVDRWLILFPYSEKGNCFPRSLALYWFAWRSGYPVLFHCGVRK